MSERMEESLAKSMREKRMPEKLCRCQVIDKSGNFAEYDRYARDFAELWYFLFHVECVQKVITYVVISSQCERGGK